MGRLVASMIELGRERECVCVEMVASHGLQRLVLVLEDAFITSLKG